MGHDLDGAAADVAGAGCGRACSSIDDPQWPPTRRTAGPPRSAIGPRRVDRRDPRQRHGARARPDAAGGGRLGVGRGLGRCRDVLAEPAWQRVRPIYAGKALMRVRVTDSPRVATVRPNSYPAAEASGRVGIGTQGRPGRLLAARRRDGSRGRRLGAPGRRRGGYDRRRRPRDGWTGALRPDRGAGGHAGCGGRCEPRRRGCRLATAQRAGRPDGQDRCAYALLRVSASPAPCSTWPV